MTPRGEENKVKRTKCSGQTCVGDLRLAAIDIGFDPRVAGMPISLPGNFASVGLDDFGHTWLIEGDRWELIKAIFEAGYTIGNLTEGATQITAEVTFSSGRSECEVFPVDGESDPRGEASLWCADRARNGLVIGAMLTWEREDTNGETHELHRESLELGD